MADKLLCRPVWASCRPGSAPLPRPGLRGGGPPGPRGVGNGVCVKKNNLSQKKKPF